MKPREILREKFIVRAQSRSVLPTSLLLAMAMLFSSLSAFAQTSIDIGTVNSGGKGYIFANDVVTIVSDGSYIITGTTDVNRVVVLSGLTVSIELQNASIRSSVESPLIIEEGAATTTKVTLTLSGRDTLEALSAGYAGLTVGNKSELLIEGADSLYVAGEIGIGAVGKPHGAIVLNDGYVVAKSSGSSPAVGGQPGGAITINGGIVYALNDGAAPAIGGILKKDGDDGHIIITGGAVYAIGDIGFTAETGSQSEGNISISGGTTLTLGKILAINAEKEVGVLISGGVIFAADVIISDYVGGTLKPDYVNVYSGYKASGNIPDIKIKLTADLTIPQNITFVIPDRWEIACNGFTITNKGVIVKHAGSIVGSCITGAKIKTAIERDSITVSPSVCLFDNTAKTPTVTIPGLKEGVDYEVAYSDNTSIGTATVTITGKGNYWGEIKKTFAIVQLSDAIKSVPPYITTTTLKPSFVASAYSVQLTASGVPATFIWSVSSGKLPDGMKLDPETGLFSGTPTKIGTYDFTIKATNEAGSDEQSFQMIVRARQRTPRIVGEADFILRPSQSSINFGSAEAYYFMIDPVVLTLSNTGSYALQAVTMEMMQGSKSAFELKNVPSSIREQTEVDIYVWVKDGMNEGIYLDTLRIYDSFSGYELKIPVRLEITKFTMFIPRRVIYKVADGLKSDVFEGLRYIESGSDFVFTITPENENLIPVVTTSRNLAGETLVTLNDDGSYTFRVQQIRTNINIDVIAKEKESSTSSETISATAIWSAESKLFISAANETAVSVFTLSGALADRFTAPSGLSSFALPKGVYIVKTADTVKKLVIR
ncbi:MAG: putative Ig domain-containing protein [Tannerella sp.]|jgi:hypothetical protein|nr:putative Ig domain-containing protein [Tannerella sp.]